jgi:hypothetical protein
MKNIEVTDEIYQDLIHLAKEMTTQDPRGTRMPHLFQIRDWKKVYDSNLNGEVQIFINQEEFEDIETLEGLISYLRDYEIEFDEDEIRDLWENDRDFGLSDFVEENCPGLIKSSYSLEAFYTNAFFTESEAKKHLERNYYHYHEKADVYLNHAWRNPEMEVISKFLCGLVGKEIYT